MAKQQLCCVLLCSIALACSVSSFDISFGDVTEVLKFSREVVTDVLESYHMIKPKRPGDDDTDFPFVKRMEKRLMNHISQVSKKIEVFEGRLEHRTEVVLDAILSKVPEREMLESSMHDLWKYLGQVDNLYQNFLHYAKAPQKFEQYTMEDFAKNAVSSSLNALPDVLKMIHRLVVPPNWDVDIFHRSILTLLAKNMQVQYIFCFYSCLLVYNISAFGLNVDPCIGKHDMILLLSQGRRDLSPRLTNENSRYTCALAFILRV